MCGCRAAFLARRPISSLSPVMRCRIGARAAADCPSSAIVKKRTASGRRSICWCASPSSRARRARAAAVRPTFVSDRLRARIGWMASIASAGFPPASSARNSGTLQAGAGGIGRDRRAQQVDAGRWLCRPLRRSEPRRHEHRPIGRGRRQVGHRAQPIDFRLRPAAKASARRRKRARRFDANGVALLRRLGNPFETVERAGAILCGSDLGSGEGNVRIGVPRHGLHAGPAEFERLGRTIQPFEQRRRTRPDCRTARRPRASAGAGGRAPRGYCPAALESRRARGRRAAPAPRDRAGACRRTP